MSDPSRRIRRPDGSLFVEVVGSPGDGETRVRLYGRDGTEVAGGVTNSVGMKRGATEVETCRLNGWGVGTRLVGDEGYGPTVIEITGMGESTLLARAVERRGKPIRERETSWTLTMRDWTEVAR